MVPKQQHINHHGILTCTNQTNMAKNNLCMLKILLLPCRSLILLSYYVNASFTIDRILMQFCSFVMTRTMTSW